MIYTKDNPKLVEEFYYFKGKYTFTGVVKNASNAIVYFLNGRYHREDGPAFEYPNGHKSWYLNGECYGFDDEYTNESWVRLVKLELLK